jgi:synaptosomal-associated protein 29
MEYKNSVRSGAARNPFGDDDEDDRDFKFGNRRANNHDNNGEEDLRQVQERIGKVENDSLESTQRALRMLNETEEIGVKTAQELVSQGEKLKRIDETLDDVDQKLTSTQKNLNQLKSVFGGLKNKFFAPKNSLSNGNLKALEKEANAKQQQQMKTSSSQNAFSTTTASKPEFAKITGSDREAELNKNLDDMSLGLSRLKSLGLDMQRELDKQDPLIGRLIVKSETTNTRVDNQNAQMKKILK